jgi:hypothetical protein
MAGVTVSAARALPGFEARYGPVDVGFLTGGGLRVDLQVSPGPTGRGAARRGRAERVGRSGVMGSSKGRGRPLNEGVGAGCGRVAALSRNV